MEINKNIESIIGDPKKAINRLAYPTILSMLLMYANNLIDSMWVSGLGSGPLAALGFMSPLYLVIIGFGVGIGAGANSLISRLIGAKQYDESNNAAIHSIVLASIISILILLIGVFFLRDLLILFGASEVIDYAMDYGVILSFGSILVILSNALYGVLRGEGDAERTMYAMLFSSILNMILDPIFIYGLNLGVKGAAIATLISLLLVNVILFYWFYFKKDTYLKPFLSNYKFNKEITIDILKVGLPASLELINNALFAALFSLLLVVVASTDAVAVYSTGWRVVTIATTPIIAIATALISVVGANYGAHKTKNIDIQNKKITINNYLKEKE